jgi:hypothetical protein
MKTKTRADRSRRWFLGTSVALGAGLAVGGPLQALGAPGRGVTRPVARGGVRPGREIGDAVALSLSATVRQGLGDVLPRPFEVDLLAGSPHLQVAVFERVASRLGRRVFDAAEFQPIEHVHLPKRQPGALRRCAVIDPVDLIAYLSLAILAAWRIEPHRPPRGARTVFSFRFSGHPRHLFSPTSTYGTFARHVERRRADPASGVLGAADIADFYDRLSLDTLRTALLRCSVEPWVVDYTLDLLAFWAAGTGRGLPVGSNASRILAEGVLAGVDAELLAAGADYARFVDDFRFFAPDAATAEAWLGTLHGALAARGLELNRAKTRLVDPATLVPLDGAGRRPHPSRRLAQESNAPTKEPAQKPEDETTKPEHPPDPNDLNPDSWKNNTRKFNRPPRSEIQRLRALDLARLDTDPRGPGGRAAAADFAAAAIYQGDHAALGRIPEVVRARPHAAAYALGALAANADALPTEVRQRLVTALAGLLDDRDLPLHVALGVVELLATDGYRSPAALRAYLGRLGPRLGGHLARAVLDALSRCDASLDRRTVARLYGRLSPWGRRALLRPPLGGAAAATVPGVVRSARRAAAIDPFMAALVERLDPPPAG